MDESMKKACGRLLCRDQFLPTNRPWLSVQDLPPYCPEFNATEHIWYHTRFTGTHNRYFPTEQELVDTLTCVYLNIQRHPEQIMGYLQPFI